MPRSGDGISLESWVSLLHLLTLTAWAVVPARRPVPSSSAENFILTQFLCVYINDKVARMYLHQRHDHDYVRLFILHISSSRRPSLRRMR